MVLSASNDTAYIKHAVSPYNYFMKQALFLGAGVIIFFMLIPFPTRVYGAFSNGLMMILGISLAILPFIGTAQNQAKSWYDLGFVSFQPSEFIKVVTIVYLAHYYDKNKNKLNTYTKSLYPIGLCVAMAFMIFIQPDLGTVIIYCAIVGVIFLAVPIKKEIKTKTVFTVIGLIVFAAFALFSVGKSLLYQRQSERLNFKNPCERLLNEGNQVCNGYIAINNGGLWGKGLGNSTQKHLYLPEPYTDFIFAIIIEELGLVTGIIIILMYMWILLRILVIGKNSKSNRGSIICYGTAFYIFVHIAINLLGLFGVMPMTGVPLPFMSYGGSFTICLVAALTMVQRVSVENGLAKGDEKNA